MDGASLGRASVQFGAAPTFHKMLFLCCHSSSTPVLSTPMEGIERILFPAVSWKEPEQGKTLYCCICYLPYLDLHYWISSAMIYVHQTDNRYSFRSSWVMLAKDKDGLKLPLLQLLIQTWFSDHSAVSAFYLINLYIYVFMYIFRFQSIILLLNSELGHFKHSIIFPLLYYAYSHSIWMPSNNNCIHVLFSTWNR